LVGALAGLLLAVLLLLCLLRRRRLHRLRSKGRSHMTVEDAAGSLSLALRVSQPLILQARHSQCLQCEPPRMSAEPAVCLPSAELLPVRQTTERSGRFCVGASQALPCVRVHARACFMTRHA